MVLNRTPLRRRSKKRSTIVQENLRCDHWTEHESRNSSRCTKQGVVIVDENSRYCKTHATWEADRLVGDFVKARDGRCVLASFNDKPCFGEQLYWCHLIPKGRYSATRWEPLNAVAGCRDHHKAFDESPLEKEAWIARHLGSDVYEELKLVAVAGAKYRPELVIREYRGAA